MGVLLMIGGKCSRLRAKPARYTDVGYILAGSVEMMIQGQPTLILHAGDSFLMPPRTPHNALDTGTPTNRSHSALRISLPCAQGLVPAQSLAQKRE